jgi:hypothetical protein
MKRFAIEPDCPQHMRRRFCRRSQTSGTIFSMGKKAGIWDDIPPHLIPASIETLVGRRQKKADRVDVKLPGDAALYIAQNVRLNERELEDALGRVMAYSSWAGTEKSLAFTQRVMKSFIDEQGREVALDSLPELTSPRFGAKKAKVRFHTPDEGSVLCLLEGRDGRKARRARNELEVNLRERERQRLAHGDAYERELERRAKKRKLG